MKFIPINWAVISSPLNWVIVLLMLTIAAFALDEIFRFVSPGDPTGCGCKKSLSPIPSNSVAS